MGANTPFNKTTMQKEQKASKVPKVPKEQKASIRAIVETSLNAAKPQIITIRIIKECGGMQIGLEKSMPTRIANQMVALGNAEIINT